MFLSKYSLTGIAAFIFIILGSCVLADGPTPFTPHNDARLWVGDPVPVFSWSTKFGAVSYYLEFDDHNDWSPSLGGLYVDEPYFDLDPYISQEDWDELTFNLYWRVRAVQFNGDLGEPGLTFHFSKTVVDPPEPWTPEDDTILRPWSQPVTFTWAPYTNGEMYWMQFADDIEFTVPSSDLPWADPYFNTLHYIPPEEWRYLAFGLFWRVSAMDRFGNKSPWGPAIGFSKLGYRRIMCFGDSITGGFGSIDFDTGEIAGYPPLLGEKLQNHDQRSSVTSDWFSGGKAEDGAANIESALKTTNAGASITMFGTVDIIDPGNCEDGDCRTIQRLGEIVDFCNEYAVRAFICTVIPYNPAGGHPKYPDVSVIQAQLDQINADIRDWCNAYNIPMVDLDQVMRDNAPGGDLSLLYYDWAHPNDHGYSIMADAILPVVISNW